MAERATNVGAAATADAHTPLAAAGTAAPSPLACASEELAATAATAAIATATVATESPLQQRACGVDAINSAIQTADTGAKTGGQRQGGREERKGGGREHSWDEGAKAPLRL